MLTIALLLSALTGDPIATSTAQLAPSIKERFATRAETRIPFTRSIRNFQVKRQDNDDVIFLETQRNTWYRSEINCFGIQDPRDAIGILPIDHGLGVDGFSRLILLSLGGSRLDCRLDRVVELTPAEAIEFRLVRQPTPAKRANANP